MTTDLAPGATTDDSFIVVVKVLLLIQGSIAITSLIEVLIASAAQGIVIFSAIGLSALGGILSLWLAGRIHRYGHRARRTVVYLQYLWLTAATIDLALSLLMTRRLLEPVALLTRIVIPITIVKLLRSQRARALFQVPAGRRARRKARKLAEAAA